MRKSRNPKICMNIDPNHDRMVYVLDAEYAILDQATVEAGHKVRDAAKQAYAKHGPCNVFLYVTETIWDFKTRKDVVYKGWQSYNWKNKTTGTHFKRQKLRIVEADSVPNMLKMAAMLLGA